ncbi:MAG TPA: alpha/beta hydrolase [Streptosporangiaceae bacterium]|nr:alpha/beta hydrolase [Streptosporangiaceae bacterium]
MSSILERPAPPPDLTVPYGALPEQVIDLCLPSGATEPVPLIVLVHGGFWRPVYDRTHLRPMAHALAALGYAVAVPEYRRAGMADDWTGTFDDIAAIFDQVTGIAAAHGADPARITWAGHSAGGHLVLWAAARPYFPAGSPWRGACDATRVVSLAGCGSLRLCAQWNLGDGAVRLLLGGGPDEVPERYAVTDPAALTPPAVPVIHVHGTDDDVVPIGMSQAFPVGRVVDLPHTGHFELIDPESHAWPAVLTALNPST